MVRNMVLGVIGRDIFFRMLWAKRVKYLFFANIKPVPVRSSYAYVSLCWKVFPFTLLDKIIAEKKKVKLCTVENFTIFTENNSL